jgi:signal transduction histidine kinase
MSKSAPSLMTVEGWQALLRQFKEALAKRLWAMPTVAESEKEIVFRQFLSDLDAFEKEVAGFHSDLTSREKSAKEENDLLRSLMGVPGDELKARVVGLAQEVATVRTQMEVAEEELSATRDQLSASETENRALRTRLSEIEQSTTNREMEHVRLRENDIRSFSETHSSLKNQVLDLESRIKNLRELFSDSNKKLASEKQEEITLLQKKLLDEMEVALKSKQDLSWAEEEMFAKGVAQKVRSVLVSAQGQLYLTLERLGLLDPETKSESFWKARFKIFVEGAEDLGKNFRLLQKQLEGVTKALDDYLHLTRRRELVQESVSLPDLVKHEMADLYLDRRPTLSVELYSDDPLPDVIGDQELLKFCVRTLIQNAVEALPNEQGRLKIALRNQMNKDAVELDVQDSGAGIPPHFHAKLFQPFFTTKPHHQGLSLSRAKRFAELHGGTLDMVSTGESGSHFKLLIPRRGIK